MTHIVVLGAGFGGTYAFKELHRRYHGNPDVSLTLLNGTNYFLFTPLLHEVATGGLSPENTVEPLRKIFHCCSYNLFVGQAQRICFKKKLVETTVGPLAFDYLVVALGAETAFYGVPGAEQHSFTLKSLDDAIRLKRHFIRICERAARTSDPDERKRLLSIAIIGGGATGVELAAEISEYFYGTFSRYYAHAPFLRDLSIRLIHRGEEIIPQFSPRLRAHALSVLRKRRVEVLLGKTVTAVTHDSIVLESGERIETATPIWVAGITPARLDGDIALPRDDAGRLLADQTLQVQGFPNVFALGDNACVIGPDGRPLPALAQVAVNQASVTAENISRLITQKGANTHRLAEFRYKSKGSMLSLGQWMAIAEIGRLPLWGHIAWWLWRTVYLSKLVSWDHKLKVAIDWTLDIFADRDISDV